MANQKFRVAPVYIGSKKWAELQNGTYDIKSNDEGQEGVDALLGYSEGIIEGTLKCDTIMPVGGMSVDAIGLILSKTDVMVGLLVGGKMLQALGRLTDASVTTTSKNGTTKGAFTFSFGTPTAT